MFHDDQGIQLATEAARHPEVFATAFNSGDPELLEQVYADDAVFVTRDGRRVVGADRVKANSKFQSIGLPIQVSVAQVHEYGDLALLVVDWTIEGTTALGEQVAIAGTATDLAQRGTDGRWRYVIDCPFGIGTTSQPRAE